MKRKLLVIFFIAIIISLLIYNKYENKENKVLYIGEKDYIGNINYNDKFLYDNITFKQLLNSIKNNDYYILKNKKIFLNQLIKDSNIIIINANNVEYNKKCNKNSNNNDYYQYYLEKNKKELINTLKKITSAKINILDNNCKNKSLN